MSVESNMPVKNQQEDRKSRELELNNWANKALMAAGWFQEGELVQFESVSGDAGFRQYYRISNGRHPILAVDAPPETEKNQAFLHMTQLLRQHGIHSPQVFAVDFEQGFLLLEDLGSQLFYPALLKNNQHDTLCRDELCRNELCQDKLYQDAMNCLQKLHSIPVEDCGLPLYDDDALQAEMDLFPEWFVEKMLGVEFSSTGQALFTSLSHLLIDSALQQTQVIVHRDFHCRNLLVIENNSPGVIDFQDAVVGPLTYDLVSLLRDCYLYWPEEKVEAWLSDYYQRLEGQGLVDPDSYAIFQRHFDFMGLQRHIKVLGIFSRLSLRDGKNNYLKDLPLVILYTLSVAKKYPELGEFVSWFEDSLLPVIKNQGWYREVSCLEIDK